MFEIAESDTAENRQGHFEPSYEVSRVPEFENMSYDEFMDWAGFEPILDPIEPPPSESLWRPPTPEEIAERWRSDYHPIPEVLFANNQLVTYRLNKEWVWEHAYVHKHLV